MFHLSLHPHSLAVQQSRRWPVTLLLSLGLAILLLVHPLARPTAAPAPAVNLDFGKLAMAFVPNAGQADPAVQFQVHDLGGTIFFTAGEAVLELPATASSGPATVRVHFCEANPAPAVVGVKRLPGTVNYFIGDDPAQWRTNLPTYAGVAYRRLYPGIDLRYDSKSGRLKGTFTVAPGADPSRIRWHYAGTTAVRLDQATGDLLITVAGTAGGGRTLIEYAPIAWQMISGQRTYIPVRHVLTGDGSVGLKVGAYDTSRPLTIDPTLVYGTYLGGSHFDYAQGVTVDSQGNMYVTGMTNSTDFPTENPLYGHDGGDDVFVAKINAAGDTLLFSTYLGGAQMEMSAGIAVDGSGNVYVTGSTNSTDFPTRNALQGSYGGVNDGFVAKLNATGSALLYSTYLGGHEPDNAQAIAVDSGGSAYVTGVTFSSRFVTRTPLRAYDGNGDAFVAKLNSAGSALAYLTYLGGSSHDAGSGIAVDGSGNTYVAGQTYSTDFPTQGPLQAANEGLGDLFVTKLNADGSTLLYSTYLGGSNKDYAYGIAVDGGGSAYVTGNTESSDFPTTTGAFDATCGTDGDCNEEEVYPGYGYRHSDAFVTKLNADGSDLVYSTYLGGSKYDKGASITVNSSGNAYVTGDTFSADFPTVSPLQEYASATGNTSMAFVTKMEADGSAPVYSTFLGGSEGDYGVDIAVDNAGNAFVAGITASDDWPTVNPLQAAHGGGDADAFVAKMSDTPATPPPFGPGLQGSTKAASEYVVASGETLTYTIRLINNGTAAATADVTDTVPAKMDYTTGSVTGGGVYDTDTRTLSWSDVAVGAGAEVSFSFAVTAGTVTTSTLVTNIATITANGTTFERHALVLLVHTRPPDVPNLFGSYKAASRYIVSSGETLTYTIRLHNSGTATATATVTDTMPAKMNYVAGSATGGGVYNSATKTLSWSNVTVSAGDSVSLAFAATATTVDRPTVVVNRAHISTDDESFERPIVVLVMPDDVGEDATPPVVHSLTIDDQDVLTDPAVTLHISATDNISVTEMYVREWQWVTTPLPHWKIVKSSGWVSYQAHYAWTLGGESGTHYVGVWVADGDSNRSHLNRQALDFVSLVVPGETVPRNALVPYMVYYEKGVGVTATLAPTSGDADLYVWYPGHFGWPPDQKSTEPGSAADEVSFSAPRAGTYLLLVHGYTSATYDLSITPGGGPRAWSATSVYGGATSQIASRQDLLSKPPIQDLVGALFASGIDPLGSSSTLGPNEIHLPLIAR